MPFAARMRQTSLTDVFTACLAGVSRALQPMKKRKLGKSDFLFITRPVENTHATNELYQFAIQAHAQFTADLLAVFFIADVDFDLDQFVEFQGAVHFRDNIVREAVSADNHHRFQAVCQCFQMLSLF